MTNCPADSDLDRYISGEPDEAEEAGIRKYKGACLTKQARYAEAERELLEAHRVLTATLGQDHKRTHIAAGRLADLYDAWHTAEPNAGYDAKASQWRVKVPTTQPLSKPAAIERSTPADSSGG